MKDYIEIVLICFLGMATVLFGVGAFSLTMDGIEQRREAKHRRMIEKLKAEGRHREIV